MVPKFMPMDDILTSIILMRNRALEAGNNELAVELNTCLYGCSDSAEKLKEERKKIREMIDDCYKRGDGRHCE
jgi:hypothetical protein